MAHTIPKKCPLVKFIVIRRIYFYRKLSLGALKLMSILVESHPQLNPILFWQHLAFVATLYRYHQYI
jgi:hypothetical protein